MRTTVLLLIPLVGLLLAVPASAGPCSGTYYQPGYGCATTSYVTSYAPAYVQPTYYQPVQQQYQNYDTIYRIAPDLAAARLAQEASEATFAKFKAEMARQAEAAKTDQERQQNRDFQQMVLQLLNRQGTPPTAAGPPAVDPQTAGVIQQLQSENAQMRAALEKIAAERSRPTAPAPADVQPPPPPRAAAPLPDSPSKAPPELVAAARKLVTDSAKGCTSCHGPANAKGLTDLTDPSKLYFEKLADCQARCISTNPKLVMPREKPPGTADPQLIGAFNDLMAYAPHDPRLAK